MHVAWQPAGRPTVVHVCLIDQFRERLTAMNMYVTLIHNTLKSQHLS